MLTDTQKTEAAKLYACRPAVIPGTRAIVKSSEARDWHEKVSEAMRANKIKGTDEITAFCDIAGVAD